MDQIYDNMLFAIFDTLNSQQPEAVKKVLETLYNGVALVEREQHLRATPHERTSERRGYANGFKDKLYKTRMGALNLKIPQTRGTNFYPSSLERGSRSERALKISISEMYLKGVSTRKVTAITEKLCGLDISSSQVSALSKELDKEFEAFRNRELGAFPYVFVDATYLKVRHGGNVVNAATFIAYGVNESGTREILGVSTALSEAEVHWRQFLESLQKRGLTGVRMIISDDHAGLKSALQATFPSVPWQRCQFHFQQNAQKYAPKKSMQEEISEGVKSVFRCPSRESAEEAKRAVIRQFSVTAPKFATWFEENIDESLTCLSFPRAHQQKIRTTNGLERVNREIKRRVKVASLFPNIESALRLVTGVLVEIHDGWITGRKYLDMSLT